MKIYINDYELICAQGNSKEQIANSLFKKDAFKSPTAFELVDNKSCPVFEVNLGLEDIPSEYSDFNSRNNRLIFSALKGIEKKVKEVISRYGQNRVGIVLGTSTSGIEEGVVALEDPSRDYNYYLQEIGSPSKFLQKYLKTTGVSYTISTACSSSARTFIEAKNLITNGICDAVIVGGCDSLSRLTVNGFYSLEAIDLEITKPLSGNRKGINIGEGAALFLLSLEKSNLAFLGGGESSDAYHISSPDPSGEGALLAMKGALVDASLEASKIDYINLHGTGTIKNDEMESFAVSSLFPHKPFVSSTKPLVGHTLGAAGAIELAISALSLESGKLPIHYYDGVYDSKIKELNIVTEEMQTHPRISMSNSYAFGGSNVSLIIGLENE